MVEIRAKSLRGFGLGDARRSAGMLVMQAQVLSTVGFVVLFAGIYRSKSCRQHRSSSVLLGFSAPFRHLHPRKPAS